MCTTGVVSCSQFITMVSNEGDFQAGSVHALGLRYEEVTTVQGPRSLYSLIGVRFCLNQRLEGVLKSPCPCSDIHGSPVSERCFFSKHSLFIFFFFPAGAYVALAVCFCASHIHFGLSRGHRHTQERGSQHSLQLSSTAFAGVFTGFPEAKNSLCLLRVIVSRTHA